MLSFLVAITASTLNESEPVWFNINQFSHSDIHKESNIPGHSVAEQGKVSPSFHMESYLKPESRKSIKIIFTKPGSLKAVECVRLFTHNCKGIGDWRWRNGRLIVAKSKRQLTVREEMDSF